MEPADRIQRVQNLIPMIDAFKDEPWDDTSADFAIKVSDIIFGIFWIPNEFSDMSCLKNSELVALSTFKNSISQLKKRLKIEKNYHHKEIFFTLFNEITGINKSLKKSFLNISVDANPCDEPPSSLNPQEMITDLVPAEQFQDENTLNAVPGAILLDKSEVIAQILRKEIDPRQANICSLKGLIEFFGPEECRKVTNLDFVPFDFIVRPEDIAYNPCYSISSQTDCGNLIMLNFPNLQTFSFKQPYNWDEVPKSFYVDGFGELVIDLNCFACIRQMESLKLENCKINNLNLLAFSYLKELSLENCQGPKRVVNGKQIVEVFDALEDYSGLRFLPYLTTLELRKSALIDLKPLASLTKLKNLTIDTSEISAESFEGLSCLTKLECLNLTNCKINDLRFLSSLRYLDTLELDNCPIQSLEPLIYLPYLQTLFINNCKILDWSPLLSIPNLASVEIPHKSSSKIPLEILKELLIKGVVIIRS